MTTSTIRRTAAKPLTERVLLALKPGQKRADGALPRFGRLIVRAQAGRALSSGSSSSYTRMLRAKMGRFCWAHASGAGMIDLSPSDISDLMARMIGKRIKRCTNIVHSMISAAFAFGAALDNDPIVDP